MTQLNFDGKVAVVTGAGLGIGRSYALELARRGARVVVNDISHDDHAGVLKPTAQIVADEIRAMGGEAIVSTDSVEFGDRIIEQTMDHYGQVDILINNAGLLRNTSFLKMTEDDWDILYRVMLLGTMRVTKAAWPLMRSARYGRILLTSSNAGTWGMIGAANYAAMKAGLTAFGQSLAIEGATREVKVNAIAPIAASRLTGPIWTPKIVEAFNPDLVAKAVMLLVHERCPATGRLFEIGGGWVSEMRWEQSDGVLFPPEFQAEDVEAQWGAITDFPGDSGSYRSNDYLARIERVTGDKIPF